MRRVLILAIIGLWAAHAIAQTVTVRNADELRSALTGTADKDVTVVVDGKIDLQGRSLRVVPKTGVVTLLGRNAAEIRFGMVWDGNWATNNKPANGLELNCRSAFIRGIAFRDYEWKGSAIKFHLEPGGLGYVEGCRFDHIATAAFPPASQPATTSENVWYGNVLGGGADAHVVVVGCTFENVCRGDAYGHAIYVSSEARSLTVSGCSFSRCGSVHRSQPNVMRIWGNTYLDNLPSVVAKTNSVDYQYWIYPRADNSVVAVDETHERCTWRFLSRFSVAGAGHVRHLIDWNDYSGVSLVEGWVFPWGKWSDWLGAGMDRASKEPMR